MVDLFVFKLGPDLALVHDDEPIAHRQRLRQFGRDHDDAATAGRQLIQDLMNFGLRADVNSSRWVVDQNPRVEAREALNILSQSIKGLPYDYRPPRLQIIFRENIPET